MQLVFVFAAENDLAILESLKIFPIKGVCGPLQMVYRVSPRP